MERKLVDFITAVSSGKRIRVVGLNAEDDEVEPMGIMDFMSIDEMLTYLIDYNLWAVQIVNAQFELEENKIEITESEFDKFFEIAKLSSQFTHYVDIRNFKKELGF